MEEKTVDVLVRKFYSTSVLAHVAHVNTRVGFHHEAIGEYYEAVSEIKDRVIEHLMGIGRLIRVNASIIEIGSDITTEAVFLADALCNYADLIDDDALENIAGELQEATGQLKYKLMFS